MIKKLLFAGALALAFNTMTAQVQVWKDDFEDKDISNWTLLDEDGDGHNFIPYDPSIAQNGQRNYMSSVSYDNDTQSPLTPDNWAISPAINVTGATGLSLSYLVGPQDPDWADETYTVYVSTGNTKADFLASAVKFSENIGDDPDALFGELVERTINLSSFENKEKIYVAIRHHNSSDMFLINFDDVTVKATTLAVSDVSKTKVSIYPNPTTEVLNVSAGSKVSAVEVFDMMGRKVSDATLVDGKVDVKNLTKGAYVLKVTAEAGSTSHKFIKN
ncbi:Por secretion system C-terminal sorting domain-containing protein [Soonwooa buanensis]|uniref:Por secretion system C-terminal sorting domain-containing protein n=1 Tax=Soonwooa buanensis TaxID=619805 RepID=A0A1T5F7E2_9FLAO|nr:choice-of-anchor J domain-containing protein [Soonwooa buanensis]SKB92050.1 Por secretion system C-terminal sorting domain-containing protein [Soonwooa buanensis]